MQFLEYFTLVEADDNVEATANEEDNSDVDVYVDGAGLNALLVIERAELRPGFRVLFSLHFSCITSMAIVYVNFDVSAKVVKCEVLDVLIALCCCVLRADGGQSRCRNPRVQTTALTGEECQKAFQVPLLPGSVGPTCRVGHFKINSSLLDGKRNERQHKLRAGKIDKAGVKVDSSRV